MADRDSILTKLEALMKRTRENGASEVEVEAAMNVARKLMDEHNIAMEEVLLQQKQSASPSSIEIKEEKVRSVSTVRRFEQSLMHVVCCVCDTKWYHKQVYVPGKRTPETMMVFYGMGHDVLASKLLFLELLVTVRAMAIVKVGGGSGKNQMKRNIYCDGFCSALYHKARTLKNQSNKAAASSTSLILVKDVALIKYGQEVLNLRTGKSRPRDQKHLSSEEFNAGYRDGDSYDLNPKREKQVAHQPKKLN